VVPLSLVSLVCEKKYENKYQHSKAENKKKRDPGWTARSSRSSQRTNKTFSKGRKKEEVKKTRIKEENNKANKLHSNYFLPFSISVYFEWHLKRAEFFSPPQEKNCCGTIFHSTIAHNPVRFGKKNETIQ
jgi:hypothetical protein